MNKYILRETPYLRKLSLVNQVNKCLKRKYPFDGLSVSKKDNNISPKRLKLQHSYKRKCPYTENRIVKKCKFF